MAEVREDLWQRYVLVSHLLLALSIGHVSMQAPGVYETVFHFLSNKTCMVVLYNYAFMLFTIVCRIPIFMFVGRLSAVETEQLMDMARNYLMDAVIFLVLSKPRLYGRELPLGTIIKYLTILVALKCFHVLIYIRLNSMFQMEIPSYWSIIRLCTFIYLMAMTDLRMLNNLWGDVNWKNTFAIWLMFELFAMLLLCVFSAMRFVVNLLDHYYEAGLGNKTTINFYLELLHDALSLTFFTVFMMIFYVHNPNNMPAYMVIDIIHVVKNLTDRVTMLMHYRTMVAIMESKYPEPTQEEKDADGTCIICRDAFGDDARKIDCGHIFHLSCLKSWLFQHSTCPTCRAPIKADIPEQKQRSFFSRLMLRIERKIRRCLHVSRAYIIKVMNRVRKTGGDDPQTQHLRKFVKSVTLPIAKRILAELKKEKLVCEFAIAADPTKENEEAAPHVGGDAANVMPMGASSEVDSKTVDGTIKKDIANDVGTNKDTEVSLQPLSQDSIPSDITKDNKKPERDNKNENGAETSLENSTVGKHENNVTFVPLNVKEKCLSGKSEQSTCRKCGAAEPSTELTSVNRFSEHPNSSDSKNTSTQAIEEPERWDTMMELSCEEMKPLIQKLSLPEWLRQSGRQRYDPNRKGKAGLVKLLKKLKVLKEKLTKLTEDGGSVSSNRTGSNNSNNQKRGEKDMEGERACSCEDAIEKPRPSQASIREIRIAKLSGNTTEVEVTITRTDQASSQQNRMNDSNNSGSLAENSVTRECNCKKRDPSPTRLMNSESVARDVARSFQASDLRRSTSNASRTSLMSGDDLPSIATQSVSGSNFSSLSLLPSSIEVPPVTPSLVRTNPNPPASRSSTAPEEETDTIATLLNELQEFDDVHNGDLLLVSDEANDNIILSHLRDLNLPDYMRNFFLSYEGLSRSDDDLRRAFESYNRLTIGSLTNGLHRQIVRDIMTSMQCVPVNRERLQALHNDYMRLSFTYQESVWRLGRSSLSMDLVDNLITSMSIMDAIMTSELEEVGKTRDVLLD